MVLFLDGKNWFNNPLPQVSLSSILSISLSLYLSIISIYLQSITPSSHQSRDYHDGANDDENKNKNNALPNSHMNSFNIGVIDANRAMAERPDYGPILSSITVPCLLVCGTEDPITGETVLIDWLIDWLIYVVIFIVLIDLQFYIYLHTFTHAYTYTPIHLYTYLSR